MKLRHYQESCIHGNGKWPGIVNAWRSNKRVLVVLPTGSGKTIIFAKLTEMIVAEGGRVLILAHREELLNQAKDKIARATGLSCAIEKAENSSVGCLEMVVVGSVQSLLNERRRSDMHVPTHIILDEAHHSLSQSNQNVLAHWPDAYVLGVTATPDRGDMKELGTYFDSLAFEYTLPEGIRDGFLTPIKALTLPLKIDISKVTKTAGDFEVSGIAKALEPYLPHIAMEIAKHCKDKKTLIFAPLCATAKDIQNYLNEAGLKCFYCSGEDRSQIPAWEKHGPGCAMVNAMLLNEGYDHPAIDAVCVLRATGVRSLYCQMVGRGTRPSPETGKTHLTLIDFLWMSEKHDLCRPANLVCEDNDLATVMTDRIDEDSMSGGSVLELSEEEISRAKLELIEKREAALAKKLAEMRHKKSQLVDPLQYAMSIGDPSLASYSPSLPSEKAVPTPMQIDRISKLGIFPGDIQSSGHAEAILNSVEARAVGNMAMPRQVKMLERYKIKGAGKMSKDQAQKYMARIIANGWRLPTDMYKLTK